MQTDADYIVVGSGAGGGTVAARLAEAGFTVVLLEAGGDPKALGGNRYTADSYDVPAFHGRSTEDEFMRWDYFVRHYADDAQQARDSKFVQSWQGQDVNGVFYPRAGTLGGCTSHNAMIMVYPHDSDWDQLADLTGDPSWRSDRMRGYFEKIENCHHRDKERARALLGANPSRHGFHGWLHTERRIPLTAALDRDLRSTIIEAARAALTDAAANGRFGLTTLSNDEADPNDWRVNRDDSLVVRYVPTTTHNGARVGARDRVMDVRDRLPNLLRLRTNCLATRVLFDGNQRAIGVEYLEGERLYRAHAKPSASPGVLQQVYASREVILAGGTFNTPQLLMLSGIGPKDELARHGIATRVDLPGVGKNLQDRYEVAIANRMTFDAWKSLSGATFTNQDQQYRDWQTKRDGVYVTNGAVLALVLRSSAAQPFPDLFLYGLVGKFTGYYPGYSKILPEHPNYLTWVILKGHTNNTAGEVTLRSADPRDTPRINFRYFAEGNDAAGTDLDAVVEGVKFARKISEPLKQQKLIAEEDYPGNSVQTPDEIKEFVRDQAWGHHAACSCPIGAKENGGVLTADLRVHGTEGLRVVDASVFPRIPGLFIASAVYMVGEKAADVIAADAARDMPPHRADVPVVGT